MTRQWLSLTDYASKYRVSVSTLRRRIKTGSIAYRFDRGRYLVADEAVSAQESFENLRDSSDEISNVAATAAMPVPQRRASESEIGGEMEEPILSSASRLLNELKRAYTSILQEKEEQIIQLKEEVSDLKTLVRVLEDDNDRMKRALGITPKI